jgi:hypothetical protein
MEFNFRLAHERFHEREGLIQQPLDGNGLEMGLRRTGRASDVLDDRIETLGLLDD